MDRCKNRIIDFVAKKESVIIRIVNIFIISFIFYECQNEKKLLKIDEEWINKLIECDNNVSEFYLAQISLSFIIITIMNVLTDKTNTLYWENLVEKKLIRPCYRSILAFMQYSFCTILVSTIGIIKNNSCVVYVSFFINIVILMILSYKMSNLYFNREKQKNELEASYENANNEERRRNLLTKLKENTLMAVSNRNADIVNENIEFYIAHCKYLDIKYLMDYIDFRNIHYAEKILNGFSEKVVNRIGVEADPQKIPDILYKWNPIYYLPYAIQKNLVGDENIQVWENLFTQILLDSRKIMIALFDKTLNVEIYEKGIAYSDYRDEIRGSINKLKSVKGKYSAKDMFRELKKNKGDKLGLKNDLSGVKSWYDDKMKNLFHDIIRHSPIRDVLLLMREIIDRKEMREQRKAYYFTIFVSVFTFFPIFGYLYRLDVNYSNNNIYGEIVDNLEYLTTKGKKLLNKDWRGLYGYIMEDKL